MTPLTTVEELQSLLESATTLEGRLVVSGAVVLVAVVLGGVVTPYLVERTWSLIEERILGEAGQRRLEEADQYVDVGPTLLHVVRVVQTFVTALMAITLLVVWGMMGPAVTALGLLQGSVDTLITVGITLVLIVGAYVAIGFLEDFVDHLAEEGDRIDQHQGEVLYRVAQVSTVVVVAVAALGLWGVELGGLLVGAGFLGIVVGMAARQTLGSVIAGFVLMFSRPFEVGDWVEVGGNEGIVTDITIVNTRLENFDGEYVVIPNDVVSNETVINRTRKGRLRLRVEVGIDYATDPDFAEEVAMNVMTDLDELMPVPRPQVVPKRFGDSAVVLELRFWIDNPTSRRRWRATSAVIRNVHEAFEREGVKIPFPQRELSGRGASGGFRVVDAEAQDLGAGAEAEPTGE
ncbi:mechanosensitive ion channel family protein [Halobacteriales archaeon QS_1_68_20]|nr:MAG: mechanosensitive ion channel family protein [Halobacteriales archaeon QS_1_68_20]